jgi:methylmalonyl-CoA/ethylmalonyl-CoA epimerase
VSNSPTVKHYILDHVAFGVSNVADVVPFLVGTLGGREFDLGAGVEFRWWQWRFERGGVIEVIQPKGDGSGFVDRFLAARGPGIHHLTFRVPDLPAAAERVKAHGYDVIGYLEASPSWREFFIHPKQAQGIVIQLAETSSEQSPARRDGFVFPDSPEPARAPADIAAIRLRANSAERARQLWGLVLGGASEEDGALLRFRWEESALEVVVQVDAQAPDGPLAIELAAAPEGLCPEDPQPALGARFLKRSSAPITSR